MSKILLFSVSIFLCSVFEMAIAKESSLASSSSSYDSSELVNGCKNCPKPKN